MALAFAGQLVLHHGCRSSRSSSSNSKRHYNNTVNGKSKRKKQQMILSSLRHRNAINIVITADMKNERMRIHSRRVKKTEIHKNRKWLTKYAHRLSSQADFDLYHCKVLHNLILDAGLEQHGPLIGSLVSMYGTCGSVEDARQLFDKFTDKQYHALWCAMISVYARNGLHEEALTLYSKMNRDGIYANDFTFSSVIKACAGLCHLKQGKCIHLHTIKLGFDSHVNAGSALVNMYVKCSKIEDARQVFDNMFERNVITWSSIISGFARNGETLTAMEYFRRMLDDSVKPTVKTLAGVLPACIGVEALNWGKEIHVQVMKNGLESNEILGSALVTMYARCNRLEGALRVFNSALQVCNRVSQRGVVLWNAIISAYSQHGYSNEALKLFRQMHQNAMKPDRITIVIIIHACGDSASLKQGKEIHCYMLKNEIEFNEIVQSALITMYGQCKSSGSARRVFDRISERNVNVWTSMISAYNGYPKKALEVFRCMYQNAVKPNWITIVSILPACGALVSLKHGKEIHCYVVKNEIEPEEFVWGALVTMYGQCRSLEAARRVFDRISEKNELLWNAMIFVYCQNGYSKKALELCRQMHQHAIKPYPATIAAILPAWNEMFAVCRTNRRVGRMMDDRDIQSLDEGSWIDFKNEIHSYMLLSYLSLLPRQSMFVVITMLLLRTFLQFLTMKVL